tara:strand:+ start:20764 stop:22767 length:2004 start_codon:yes stop_codon:yes gene_type:complete
MKYQNPEILYALFAVLVPIIIHLLNLRKYKNIYFSSIRFLKKISEEKKQKLKLKNILILISRILAITFLVLTFAQPFKSISNKNNLDNIFIYVDNSFSMDAETKFGRALNIAKEKAKIIANNNSDKNLYFITNNFSNKNKYKFESKNFINEINNIESTYQRKTFSEILSFTSFIKEKKRVFYISDLQKSSFDIENIKYIDSSLDLSIVPVDHKTSNTSIDSIWLVNPITKVSDNITLYAQLTNYSDIKVTDKVVFLYINNQQKSQQYINLKAGETKTINFVIDQNNDISISGYLNINDSPVTYDNKCYFNLNLNKKTNILCINNQIKNKYLNALFSQDSLLFNYSTSNINNLNYNTIKNYDLIIINEINNFPNPLINLLIDKKNNFDCVIIPPNDIEIESFNNSLSKIKLNTINRIYKDKYQINKLDDEHPIFKNVFDNKFENIIYPYSNIHLIKNKNYPSTNLLSLENGNPFLTLYKKDNKFIYMFNSTLDNKQNNLTQHAIFVPLFMNIASLSLSNQKIYYNLKKLTSFKSKYNKSKNEILNLTDGNNEFIVERKNVEGEIYYIIRNILLKNGIYNLKNKNKIVDKIAFNFDKKESNIKLTSRSEIYNWRKINNLEFDIIDKNISNFKKYINKNNIKIKEYWILALILSLIFFALEIFLIKYLKS